MASLESRIAALERPKGGACLGCELEGLSGEPVTRCTHPLGLNLVDILKTLPQGESLENDYAKS